MRFPIFFFYFIFSVAGAQQYIPLDTMDHDWRIINKELFTRKLNNFSEKIESDHSAKISNEIKESLDEFQTFFSKNFDNGKYVYNSSFNHSVDSIYKEIYLNNTIVPKDLQILISRDISLNAQCFVNGTLIVNLGAIRFLENEDQLAAIICHEVAHKILEHSEKAIVNRTLEKFAYETRKEQTEIKRQKYNRQKLAFSILKEKLYSKGKMNKRHEFEADSLGYILLRNTKYRSHEFIKSLELSFLFDTIQPADLNISTYKAVFNLPEQPFNDFWLEQEDFTQYDYVFQEKFSRDSLSTHPEIDSRIKKLKKDFVELRDSEGQKLSVRDTLNYQRLRNRAKKEQVPSLFYGKEYGFCIYLALYRIQENDMIDFHKMWLGKAFYKMYEARKSYMANKYLDRIDPKNQSESYQQFINFMWNLRLDEVKEIATHYSSLDLD